MNFDKAFMCLGTGLAFGIFFGMLIKCIDWKKIKSWLHV